jgi:hypothetical protein
MIRVWQFGMRAPTENERMVREQLRAAHEYRNELVSIERGRRWALRQVDRGAQEVLDAEAAAHAATTSERKAAVAALRAERKKRREEAADELAIIAEREHALLLSARGCTPCYWGTYITIEESHRQSRAQPLYGDDAVTDNDPAFSAGPRWRESYTADDPRGTWWLRDGQLSVQLQGGLTVAQALGGADTRMRLVLSDRPGGRGRQYGTLWLRVGSDGRAPIWAKWPIKLHRMPALTDVIKWARASVRTEGINERWSCELTIESASAEATMPRLHLDDTPPPPRGAVGIEWSWDSLADGSLRVARWADTRGASGDVLVSARDVACLAKAADIRALRDILGNDARKNIAAAIVGDVPRWLAEARNTMHLWKSPSRLHALAMRWSREAPTCCPDALGLALTWADRDRHLWDYEACSRQQVLRRRREQYRLLAAAWRGEYEEVILSDQDLSREARWGDDSDRRFAASPSELRQALQHACGARATKARWRDGAAEDEPRSWCERRRDEWIAGGARDAETPAKTLVKGGAWSRRRAKKKSPTAPIEDCSKTPEQDGERI